MPPPSFFSSSHFAVVGASTDRAKYGNRVLRWYLDHNLPVQPVNPRESHIEGLPVLSSLSQLKDPTTASISIITPPAVSIGVVKEALALGIRGIWLQPGAESQEVATLVRAKGVRDRVLYGGPCILVQGERMMGEEKAGKL